MMRLVLALCAILTPSYALAATGSGAADTWYVRPTGACANNGDGLSYGCAASNGAAGAFSTFANIIWTSTTGVDDGDTLYVCGAHLTSLIPSASGSAGAPITISMACPSDAGTINTVSGVNHTDGIALNDVQWITLDHVTLLGAVRFGILALANTLNPMRGIVIQHSTIDNRVAHDTTNGCHAIYFLAVGSGTHADLIVQNNIGLGTSLNCTGQDNNDDLNIETCVGACLIQDNDFSGGHEGIDISSGANSGVVIRRNYLHDNRASGLKQHGQWHCVVGATITANLMVDNGQWGLIFQDARNSVVVNNTIIHHGTFPGISIALVNATNNNGETCTQTSNTYVNNIITADFNQGVVFNNTVTRAQFEAQNVFNGNALWQRGAQTPLLYFSQDTGNNVAIGAGFTTWQATHANDKNTDPANELNNYTTDFKTRSTSVFRRAGVPTAACHDYRGRGCYPDTPDIGAYQASSGDLAVSRTARTP